MSPGCNPLTGQTAAMIGILPHYAITCAVHAWAIGACDKRGQATGSDVSLSMSSAVSPTEIQCYYVLSYGARPDFYFNTPPLYAYTFVAYSRGISTGTFNDWHSGFFPGGWLPGPFSISDVYLDWAGVKHPLWISAVKRGAVIRQGRRHAL